MLHSPFSVLVFSVWWKDELISGALNSTAQWHHLCHGTWKFITVMASHQILSKFNCEQLQNLFPLGPRSLFWNSIFPRDLPTHYYNIFLLPLICATISVYLSYLVTVTEVYIDIHWQFNFFPVHPVSTVLFKTYAHFNTLLSRKNDWHTKQEHKNVVHFQVWNITLLLSTVHNGIMLFDTK